MRCRRLEDSDITIDASRGSASADISPLVWLDGSVAGDSAGLEILASSAVIRGLGISGFGRYGIGVIGPDASDALIEGNWIGLTSNGGISPNRLSGVAVLGGASGARIFDNRIGGNAVATRTGHGVVIGGGGSVDTEISGNVIGITVDGAAAPNDDGVLIVDSAQAEIRGNTIGYSKVAGIELRESRLAMDVSGNRIGVLRDASEAPNNVGIFLGPGTASARIGENVVAANRVGVAVEQGARESVVEHNWIGLTPSDGSLDLSESDLPRALPRPNRERGVSVIAGAAQIEVRRNFVSAGDFGVVVDGASTTQITLARNAISGARTHAGRD